MKKTVTMPPSGKTPSRHTNYGQCTPRLSARGVGDRWLNALSNDGVASDPTPVTPVICIVRVMQLMG